jgi:uncharacterized membrane protein YbhN (UPF0104 family)
LQEGGESFGIRAGAPVPPGEHGFLGAQPSLPQIGAVLSESSTPAQAGMASPSTGSGWRLWRLGLVLAVLGAAVWYFRNLDVTALAKSLAQADWAYAVFAALLNATGLMTARALRWRALLPRVPRSGKPAGLGFLLSVVYSAFAMSNLLPFRAGEAVRMTALRERYRFPFSALVAVQLVEKLVEAMSLTAYALPVALWPRRSALPMVLAVAIGGAVVAFGISSLARGRRRAWRWQWMRRVAEAVGSLESRRAWLWSFGWALVVDIFDIAMIVLCGSAVGLDIGFLTACGILVGVNLAALLPSSPGQIGLVEAGAVVVLSGAGVSQPQALAFALVYHAAHWVPTTLGGGAVLATGELLRLRKK